MHHLKNLPVPDLVQITSFIDGVLQSVELDSRSTLIKSGFCSNPYKRRISSEEILFILCKNVKIKTLL